MPALPARSLVNAILSAIDASGCGAAYLSSRMREHPRRIAITLPDNRSISVWVYAWTLTHGGRTSLPHEYRIQMTSVSSPLGLNPNGETVLIGYEPDLRLFAGFDLSRHRTFTTGSPSVQVDINVVRQAIQLGLSFDRKSNQEIAVGIRPDHLVDYILNATELHRFGRFTDTFRILNRVVNLEDVSEGEIQPLAIPRRRIVETVSRLSRSGNFRQCVMNAYGNRCSVTRAQLRLVDAAHILPVGSPGSSDDVRNGLALSPTYHRAYDAGLIYLNTNYEMRINSERVTELRSLNLEGGLRGFQSHLGRINLPPDRQQWPNTAFIRQANRYRNIQTS